MDQRRAAPGGGDPAVMAEYFETMRQFLETQERVMAAYMSGDAGGIARALPRPRATQALPMPRYADPAAAAPVIAAEPASLLPCRRDRRSRCRQPLRVVPAAGARRRNGVNAAQAAERHQRCQRRRTARTARTACTCRRRERIGCRHQRDRPAAVNGAAKDKAGGRAQPRQADRHAARHRRGEDRLSARHGRPRPEPRIRSRHRFDQAHRGRRRDAAGAAGTIPRGLECESKQAQHAGDARRHAEHDERGRSRRSRVGPF